MKFVVLGAGAIGAYVGAALARGGADVTLIARGAQLEALRTHGVRVLSPRGNFEAAPPATDDLGAIADADVVFLGLKAYHLPEIASDLGAGKRESPLSWSRGGSESPRGAQSAPHKMSGDGGCSWPRDVSAAICTAR